MNLLLGSVCGQVRHYRPELIDGKWWKHYSPDKYNPIRFVTASRTRILTPCDKFVYDGATIPRLAWPLIGTPTGAGTDRDFMLAAVLHDWAYECQQWDNGEKLSREDADNILAITLDWAGLEEWRVRSMYVAVRAFGSWHWNKHRGKNPPTYGG